MVENLRGYARVLNLLYKFEFSYKRVKSLSTLQNGFYPGKIHCLFIYPNNY
jgi:hypothetical protein